MFTFRKANYTIRIKVIETNVILGDLGGAGTSTLLTALKQHTGTLGY